LSPHPFSRLTFSNGLTSYRRTRSTHDSAGRQRNPASVLRICVARVLFRIRPRLAGCAWPSTIMVQTGIPWIGSFHLSPVRIASIVLSVWSLVTGNFALLPMPVLGSRTTLEQNLVSQTGLVWIVISLFGTGLVGFIPLCPQPHSVCTAAARPGQQAAVRLGGGSPQNHRPEQANVITKVSRSGLLCFFSCLSRGVIANWLVLSWGHPGAGSKSVSSKIMALLATDHRLPSPG